MAMAMAMAMRRSTGWRLAAPAGVAVALLAGWAGPVAGAPGAPAEDGPVLEAAVSPATVAPGGPLAYRSVDPCPVVQGAWVQAMVGPDGWFTTGRVPHDTYSQLLELGQGS